MNPAKLLPTIQACWPDLVSDEDLEMYKLATADVPPAAIREAVVRTVKGYDGRDNQAFPPKPPEFATFARRIAKVMRENERSPALPSRAITTPGLSPIEIKMAEWSNEERVDHERIGKRTRELMARGMGMMEAANTAAAEIADGKKTDQKPSAKPLAEKNRPGRSDRRRKGEVSPPTLDDGRHAHTRNPIKEPVAA